MADRWEILAEAAVTTEPVYQEHMKAFVKSFVEKQRQERWLYLLLERPKSVFKNSHKLYDHLNRDYCIQTSHVAEITSGQTGVFYDFYDQPHNLTMAQAEEIGTVNDAIFSIKPGNLALFFFHESEIWLCKK